MVLMRKIIKRPRARTDIKDIWRYTFDEWGEIQANSYLKSMEECLIGLAQSPKHGSAVVHQQAGLRQYRYKKHLIIYLHTETTLDYRARTASAHGYCAP